MRAPQSERLEVSLLSMRDPLGRIGLAASELERGGDVRALAELVATIRASVDDLDGRVQQALGMLRGPRAISEAADDCAPELARLIQELQPVFHARSRILEAPERLDAAVRADSHLARRGALQLLQAAGSWTGRGGRLRLALLDEEARWGIRVEASRGDASGAASGDAAAFEDAERFASAQGADFERLGAVADPTRTEATLWFSRDGGAS